MMETNSKNATARIHLTPGFQWDAQDAYLFDIDGTLLRSRDRVHFDSIPAGVRHVMGLAVTLDGVAIHGSTDTAILREACAKAGIPEGILEPQVAAILEACCNHVAERRGELQPYLMPGVRETLHHLALRGAVLGVATGNLEAIGWIKIERAGLREWFQFGGFSDQFPARSELIAEAARKARLLSAGTSSVCVVGDTPRDIEAAHANDLPVIAVATGHFSYDELLSHRPTVCTTTLADLLTAAEARS